MQYEYRFCNETITIDVDDAYYEILISLDHEEYNLNRKHERRYPLSLEVALIDFREERDNGRFRRRRTRTVNGTVCDNPIAVDETDLLNDLISAHNHQMLRQAIHELLLQQQKLIVMVFYQGRTLVSIANEEGVSEAAIRNRLKKIYAKLKKALAQEVSRD